MRREWTIAADIRQERVKLIHCLVAVEQVQPTQILPELRLDPDLYEVILKQDSIVFTHKPEQPHQRSALQAVAHKIYDT